MASRASSSREGSSRNFRLRPIRPRCCAPTSRCRIFWTRQLTRTSIDSPGLLSRNHQLFLGLLDSQVHSADQIGDMVIKNVNDTPVRIRDVGTVTPSSAPAYTVVTANAKPAVLLSINRQPDSNTVEVANEVNQQINAIRPTLPAGVELNVFYDQSNIVRESIGSVRDAIIIGLILSGVIIWLFLRGLGYGAGDGTRCSRDHPRDFPRDEDHGPDLQHDDVGRPGGGERTGGRHRDRGRRKHRFASRRRRRAPGSGQQRHQRADGSAGRLDADSHRRVLAFDLDHGRYREFSSALWRLS